MIQNCHFSSQAVPIQSFSSTISTLHTIINDNDKIMAFDSAPHVFTFMEYNRNLLIHVSTYLMASVYTVQIQQSSVKGRLYEIFSLGKPIKFTEFINHNKHILFTIQTSPVTQNILLVNVYFGSKSIFFMISQKKIFM